MPNNRRSSDLSPDERGYAPATDHLGNALSDIRDPEPQGTSLPVFPFEAYRKQDGKPVLDENGKPVVVTVDARTFDPATMSLVPVEVA